MDERTVLQKLMMVTPAQLLLLRKRQALRERIRAQVAALLASAAAPFGPH
jgi:hypothetical protein